MRQPVFSLCVIEATLCQSIRPMASYLAALPCAQRKLEALEAKIRAGCSRELGAALNGQVRRVERLNKGLASMRRDLEHFGGLYREMTGRDWEPPFPITIPDTPLNEKRNGHHSPGSQNGKTNGHHNPPPLGFRQFTGLAFTRPIVKVGGCRRAGCRGSLVQRFYQSELACSLCARPQQDY